MAEPDQMASPGGTVYMYTLKKGTGKLGYEGVFEPHKGKGFHAKLRLDPHSKDQTTLPGAACQGLRRRPPSAGIFFLPRESRVSRIHCFGKIAAQSCAESCGCKLWRPNDQLLSLKPADLSWQAGYGGHDGRLTDVVQPSVPSADLFEKKKKKDS
jgi:hypothetical protein